MRSTPQRSDEKPASLVRAKVIGRLLSLSDRSIYNYYAKGTLPGYTIGNAIRFDVEEVLATVKANGRPQGLYPDKKRPASTITGYDQQ
ncbi:MAG: helix-turn-helix domain-containing protein [Verrucomicrobiota bacterium]